MTKSVLAELTFDTLISRIYHSMTLIKQQELNKFDIAPRQLYVLHVIHALGKKATAPEVAKAVDREINVISKMVCKLEEDGLVKRTKNKPKSNLLSLELTRKGLEMIKINTTSESINKILSTVSGEDYEQMSATLTGILSMLDNLRQSPE